jgi:hypothetical protein
MQYLTLIKKLTPLTSPWPFAKWGVDIVGLMPLGKGNQKFLIVAVDYFTKWAEAETVAAITTTNVTSFLWKSVVCRFGIPHAFVTDNGKQFDCGPFQKWCSKLRIVGSPSFRVAYYNPGLNDERVKLHLDLLPEKRDDAQVTWAAYQDRTARYFNKMVVPRKFQSEIRSSGK